MTESVEYIRFRCTRCTHGVKVKAKYSGRAVFCPACYEKLTVPSASEPGRTEVDPSQLYGVDAVPRDVRQMTERFAFSGVDCSVCGAKIAVLENQIGTKIECPDCGTRVLVSVEKLRDKNDYLSRLNASSAPFDPDAKKTIPAQSVYGIDDTYVPPDKIDALGHPIGANDNRPQFASNVRDDRFSIYCPLCATMQYVGVEQVGSTIGCPDCERDFVVKKPVELDPQPHASGAIHFEGGTVYGIAGASPLPPSPADSSSEKISTDGANTPPRGTGPTFYDPSTDPNLLAVTCKLCGTLMHAPQRMLGQKKRCPDCETETLVAEPKSEKKIADEVIEPEFSGGYVVGDVPKPEERFHHEPEFLLGKIKTPIELALERKRFGTKGPPNAKPASSSPKSPKHSTLPDGSPIRPLPPEVKRGFAPPSKPKKAKPEPFAPETTPYMPVAEAFARRNQRPPLQTTVRQVATPPPTPASIPPTPEERAMAGLAALEQQSDRFEGGAIPGFVAAELPQIDPKKRTSRGKKTKPPQNKKRRGKTSQNDSNGLIAKINERGDVILSSPSPPRATMAPALFAPLAHGGFWLHWLGAMGLGVVLFLLFLLILLLYALAAGNFSVSASLFGPAPGFVMILVSVLCVFSIGAAFWIKLLAENILSVFIALVAGSRYVKEWMEEDFFAGIITGLRLFTIAAIAILPFVVTRFFVKSPEFFLLGPLISILVFFPVVFFSTMQSDLFVMPLTRTVLASFFRRFGSWFFFYVWSAILFGLPIAGLLSLSSPIFLGIGAFVAVLLIPPVYSVLLGRLGWVIQDMARDLP